MRSIYKDIFGRDAVNLSSRLYDEIMLEDDFTKLETLASEFGMDDEEIEKLSSEHLAYFIGVKRGVIRQDTS